MRYFRVISILLLTAVWVVDVQPVNAAEDDITGPVTAVQTFNGAITARDIDAALTWLAAGSVQIQLRPAHPGMAGEAALTADLHTNWQMVAAIVFPTTQAYERQIEVTDANLSGDIATVWTDTMTRTVSKDDSVRELQFTEVYLLVRKDGHWKIAAVADNRNPGKSAVDLSAADQ